MNTRVEFNVREVANGFVVSDVSSSPHPNMVASRDDVYVAESRAALLEVVARLAAGHDDSEGSEPGT